MTEITVVIEPPLPDIEVTLAEVGLVGPAGAGVPVGGTTGQVLAKASNTDRDTEWVDQTGGVGGGGSTVTLDADGTLVVDGLTVEVATDAQLAAEATTRATADTALAAADAAEATSRAAADTTLTSAVAAEAVTRAADDATEAATRASADTALDGRLDTVETTLPTLATSASVTTEATTRAAADTTETAARIAADALKADLVSGTVPDAQIHASIARDTEVTAAVAAEATARATAISTAINNLINSAPGTLDTLGEIATQLAADESTAAALATTVAGKQPLDADLTTIAAIDSTVAGALVTDGSGWFRKTYAQLKTALSLVKGDVGLGNVDNTSDAAKPVSTAQQTALDAKLAIASNLSDLASVATARTNLGLGTAATHAHGDYDAAGAAAAAQAASQPLDSDLTAIAALTTTSFGRALLALADAAAGRTALGLGTAATVDTGTISGAIPLLGTGGVVPIARLATGTPDGTKFLRDDNTLAAPSAANGVPTGGSTGQVLAKTSSADYAQAWTAPPWVGVTPASRHSYLTWNYDPIEIDSSSSSWIDSGQIKLYAVPVPADMSVTNIVMEVSGAGSGLTAGQSLAGIYNPSGTRLAVTADQSASWTSTGVKTMALTGGPIAIPTNSSGFVWLAFLCVGTTIAKLRMKNINLATPLAVLANAQIRSGKTNLTGQTSLPSSFTPANNIANSTELPWVALS